MSISNEKILENELSKIVEEINKLKAGLRVLVNYTKVSYGLNDEKERRFDGKFTIRFLLEDSYNSDLSEDKRKEIINKIRNTFRKYNEDIVFDEISEYGVEFIGVQVSFENMINKGVDTKSRFKVIKRIIDSILKREKRETFKKEINTFIEYTGK